MPVGITELAHSLRKHAALPVPISLGHWQQFACAALGHKSLASFQAAQNAEREPQEFDRVPHVVPDLELLAERAKQLSIPVQDDELQALVKTAFKGRLPKTKINSSYDDLAADFLEFAQEAVLADDAVNSEMANANFDGVEEVYFDEDLKPQFATLDLPYTETVPVQVTLGIDTERPYSGHQVMCKVAVTSTRCGLRCFETPEVEVLSAGLDQDWGDEDHEGPPVRSMAQALADELGIEVEDAKELVDAEAIEDTGNSDEMVYGYVFDFTDHASPELASSLMLQRGSLQLRVGPNFFEGIRGPDLPN
jgi:hypothetical protein